MAVVFALAGIIGLVAVSARQEGGAHEGTHGEKGEQGDEAHTSGTVRVPDVVGLVPHEAEELLHSEELKMSFGGGGSQDGVVVSQEPEPGKEVEADSTVTVELGEVSHTPHPVQDEGHTTDPEDGHPEERGSEHDSR